MKATSSGKPTQPGYATMSASNPSMLLEKLNARRSTPDSEALASSDDEPDSLRVESHQPIAAAHKPVRRASWLNDTTLPLSQPRKGSFASSSMSPTTSHPSTPSAESGAWVGHVTPTSSATGLGRGNSGSTSFPWGTGIWNTADSRVKEPPSRLTEVLPSPTSMLPSHPGNGVYGVYDGNGTINHRLSREQLPETQIPFAIPLHPTPKTYRSQSYSVGQLESDSSAVGAGPTAAPGHNGRGRGLHSSLQHRPSRPSMLSEMSNDGTGLGKLKEVEDDEDESTGTSTHSVQLQENQAKALELLSRENAILRQQQYQSLRIRPRSSTTNTAINNYGASNAYGIQDSLPEESDYAIDELDEISELQDIANRGIMGRRMSEYSAGQLPRASTYMSPENRKLESVKKAYWQSSLGFGGLSDIPQSRRHSFADIPTRQGSVSSAGDPLTPRDLQASEHVTSQEFPARFIEGSGYPLNDHGEISRPPNSFTVQLLQYTRDSSLQIHL
jgi:hypothetical protein